MSSYVSKLQHQNKGTSSSKLWAHMSLDCNNKIIEDYLIWAILSPDCNKKEIQELNSYELIS